MTNEEAFEFYKKHKDDLFFKELFNPRPASISYSLDGDGHMERQFKGRSIDLQFLAASILADTAKYSGMLVKEFIEMIKMYVLEICKTENDNSESRNVTFEEMFKDLFE